jgi:hypothetical protein
MDNISRTNWARIDAIEDEDIDTSDIPSLTDEFFAKTKLRLPSFANKDENPPNLVSTTVLMDSPMLLQR